jgi:Penicillin-insensitive murein endopeptidase
MGERHPPSHRSSKSLSRPVSPSRQFIFSHHQFAAWLPPIARTSTPTCGRRRTPRSSRRLPRTRSSSASSSTLRSRRRCAARRAMIEAGSTRCDPGHDYHFHVRIKCPADSPDCRPQDPVPAGEVCGNDLDHWFTDTILYPRPAIPSTPKPPLTMADLAPACRFGRHYLARRCGARASRLSPIC